MTMYRIVKHSLLLVWLLAVSFAYYRLFPFPGIFAGLPQLPSLAVPWYSLEHLFCLLLVFVSANGWGSFFWARSELSHTERFVFATLAGLGIISLLVLLLNCVPEAGKAWYFGILLSGVALFLALAARKLPAAQPLRFRLLLLLSLPPVLSALIGALAPPTQFDSLAYHLALPARYLSSGRMFAGDTLFFSFPQGLEMLFQLALKIDGDILANLVGWSFLPLGGLALYAFSRRYWGSRTGLFAALFWLFTPETLFLATGTYVDLGLACFAFASIAGF
ncbi:MAG: hypothetical protein ACYC5N_06275, partial [Endomicrobiales bacterium]